LQKLSLSKRVEQWPHVYLIFFFVFCVGCRGHAPFGSGPALLSRAYIVTICFYLHFVSSVRVSES